MWLNFTNECFASYNFDIFEATCFEAIFEASFEATSFEVTCSIAVIREFITGILRQSQNYWKVVCIFILYYLKYNVKID